MKQKHRFTSPIKALRLLFPGLGRGKKGIVQFKAGQFTTTNPKLAKLLSEHLKRTEPR